MRVKFRACEIESEKMRDLGFAVTVKGKNEKTRDRRFREESEGRQ